MAWPTRGARKLGLLLAVTVVVIAALAVLSDGGGRSACLIEPLTVAVELDDEVLDHGTPEIVLLQPDRPMSYATPGWVAVGPSFNSSGTRLVVTRADGDYASSGPNGTELWIVDRDGGNPERLTSGPFDSEADWALDGGRIAFTRQDTSGKVVMTVPERGGEPTIVYEPPSRSWHSEPTWSPDGKTLAFFRVLGAPAGNGRAELVTMDPGGEASEPHVIAEYRFPGRIDWHPDGRSLLVVTDSTALLVDARSGKSFELAEDVRDAAWTGADDAVVYSQRSDGALVLGRVEDRALRHEHNLAAPPDGLTRLRVEVARCS